MSTIMVRGRPYDGSLVGFSRYGLLLHRHQAEQTPGFTPRAVCGALLRSESVLRATPASQPCGRCFPAAKP